MDFQSRLFLCDSTTSRGSLRGTPTMWPRLPGVGLTAALVVCLLCSCSSGNGKVGNNNDSLDQSAANDSATDNGSLDIQQDIPLVPRDSTPDELAGDTTPDVGSDTGKDMGTDLQVLDETGCTPDCGTRQCGPDGCGGSCGDCPPPTSCDMVLGGCTCTADCAGRECGSDGCWGSCGECPPTQQCSEEGKCGLSTCGHLTTAGCCSGTLLKYCSQDGGAVFVECGENGCGWNEADAYYDCGNTGADPSGNAPIECPEDVWSTCFHQGFNGHSYAFCSHATPLSWNQASQICKTWGGELVGVETSDEAAFLSNYYSQSYYLGLSDAESETQWAWSSGSPYNSSVQVWCPGEPSNAEEDCALGNHNSLGCLAGVPCNQPESSNYVCEKPCSPVCTGKQCGDDTCGGSCGNCPCPNCNPAAATCHNGQCVSFSPKTCGIVLGCITGCSEAECAADCKTQASDSALELLLELNDCVLEYLYTFCEGDPECMEYLFTHQCSDQYNNCINDL